jgi:hypothetical protein
METIELKKFQNRQDFIDAYNFPRGKSNEIDALWFMLPLEVQMRSFVNGLGRVIYFKTKKMEEQMPTSEKLHYADLPNDICYLMVTDYVLLTEFKHKFDCDCGVCSPKDRANLVQLEGYDDCYLGVAETYGENPAVCYDYEKIIKKLTDEGMDAEEAEDYFDYNIVGAYFGEKMPIFLIRTPIEELSITIPPETLDSA